MANGTPISLTEMIACVDRELKMRARVYPRWVADKKMLQATADVEIARMKAIRENLSQQLADSHAKVSA